MSVRIILIIFFLLSIAVPSVASIPTDNEYFKLYNLQVTGKPIDYKVEDLNDDGLNDLLVSHLEIKDEKRLRHFSVFFQDETGYMSSADQSFEVDENAVIYDIADVTGAPGKEIVFFKNDGLYYYSVSDEKYQLSSAPLLKADSIFKIPDDSFFEHFDFIRDVNGDGNEEILIPQFNQYFVYHKNTAGTYELKSSLNAKMFNKLISSREISRYLVSSYAIPNMIIEDYNRDQRKDIIIVQNRYLQVFFQDEKGFYSNTRSVNVDFGMELNQAYSLSLGQRSRFQRNRLKDKTGINTLRDLNNDGLLDIIIEKFSFTDSAFNPKKKFYFFYGTQNPGDESVGGIFPKKPDQIIVSRGVHVNSWVQDLNKDQKMDIIIPAVEVGLFKIISMVITGSIDVTAYTYLMDENGNYPQVPNEETTFSMTINRTGRKIPVEDFEGDYNGDGRKDFLGSKSDSMFITFGPEDGKLEIKNKNVEFDFQIPSNGMNVKPEYINADEKSDLVIMYQQIKAEKTEVQKNICILMTNT